jgi:hypothetical protein
MGNWGGRGAPYFFESAGGELSIFTCERHDVRDGGNGDQCQVIVVVI